MSTKTQLTPDGFERLKSTLDDAPRNHEFLAGYVRELELHRNEEDIFRRLGFEHANSGGAYGRDDRFIVSVYSELYEPLNADQKVEVRRWWHKKVRSEAESYADLKARLAGWRSL